MGERLVVTTMRNEGPFILEWVTWYLMLGFDHIVIFYNDCTDHSPGLLRRLSDAGLVTAVEYKPKPKKPVKQTALPLIMAHPRVQAAEWVLNIDVDEFLVIHVGDGRLDDLFSAFKVNRLHGIGIYWKCFGDSGRAQWEDGLTHRQFNKASESKDRANIFFKTLIRNPADFKKIGIHSPKGWQGEGQWGTAPNVFKRCDGATMRSFDPDTNSILFTKSRWITHEYAQLNHYAVRTRESFELKFGTPSPAANKDRYTEKFFEAKNLNTETDESALKYAELFDAIYKEVSALPDVMKLHHRCCMDYVERLGEVHGFDAKDDPRWKHHRREKNARS
ncbi:glycosyltransferase family 2 protein [Celeribacter litoreus]|uniref:glycosyltransferase family 2 protein n=1 Tax=Celeribacter litoreus TaxID=2876714 RepID=UPI001CCE9F20|nr:glycosyltransferase family 2 protein [Celeribacter litoreus]MCA0042406.1 glycosyltransferase family 2 protein [Celeribacter litoreus]